MGLRAWAFAGASTSGLTAGAAVAAGRPDVAAILAVCGLLGTLIVAVAAYEIARVQAEPERLRAESERDSRRLRDKLTEEVVRGEVPAPTTAKVDLVRALTGTAGNTPVTQPADDASTAPATGAAGPPTRRRAVAPPDEPSRPMTSL